MGRRDRDQKRSNPWGFVIVILLSLFSEIGFSVIGSALRVILLAALALAPVLLVILTVRSSRKKPSRRTEADCPRPLCFHRDRGEHHVRKGKEIDPWDRPDIDISKYQRRN